MEEVTSKGCKNTPRNDISKWMERPDSHHTGKKERSGNQPGKEETFITPVEAIVTSSRKLQQDCQVSAYLHHACHAPCVRARGIA